MTNNRYINEESANSRDSFKTRSDVNKEIQVTIRLPEKVPENVKQRKINRIYDILNPDNFR